MNTIKKIIDTLEKFPSTYPHRDYLIKKIKYDNPHSDRKFKEIKSTYKVDNFKLIGSIAVNIKKLDSIDYYDFFLDNTNFFDLSSDKDYEEFIKLLSSPIQKETKLFAGKEKIIKTTDEIIDKYGLYHFKDKLENFHSLSPVEQGEMFYDVKKIIQERFVSFYKDLGVDKSKVSIRAKLYDFSLRFPEFKNIIQQLKIGTVGCLPKNDITLSKLILEKINLGELKQDRNEILLFINQRKFNNKEQQLDNYLIKLRLFLDKKRYAKLSDKEQQRIINHFNKINKILEN